ncbi:TetR/AcrR family transcriptional regulator [Okibacterium endophyticum]
MAGRGQYAKGRARRDEILETALRVLAEKGYRNTSLRKIGRELGIQPAHILHYFASREELLEEVLRLWSPDIDDHEQVPAHMLDNWVEVVRHNATIPGIIHLYTAFAAEAADPTHPSHDFFQQRFSRLRTRVTDAIRHGQQTGRFDPSLNPDTTATKLIAVSDGLQLQWLIDPSIDMAQELAETITLLEQ